MKITICASEKEFYSVAAWRIADEIIHKPDAVIGLATGRTTGGIHKALCDIHKAHPFDVSRVTIFGMDEVTGVDREYFGSCYYMLLHEVVLPMGIPLQNYIMPPTRSDDFKRDGQNFMDAIAARGPVDLQVLGIGENGHIGFNQPGTPFDSTVWHSKMDARLDARIRGEVGASPEDELGGLTIGIKDAMMSKKILLVANGKNKTEIVRAALKGPITTDLPSSILQLHPFCETILDPDAAAGL